MIKKISFIVSFILLFLVGGIIFWLQNQPKPVFKRDYIVVSVQGEVNYLYPLPFKLHLTVYEIICYFGIKPTANLQHVYLKKAKTWQWISLKIKIVEDSVFKIEA